MIVNKTSKVIQYVRVICALMLREMTTRYGRSRGGYVWAVIEPVGMILILTSVFAQFFRSPPLGDNFALFYATGFVPFFIFNDIAVNSGNAIKFNKPLMYFPVVTPIDVILARFLLSFFTSILVTSIIFCGLNIIIDQPTRLDGGGLIVSICAAASLGLGVGTFNAYAFSQYPMWQNIWGIFNRPILLISGVFYTFESLPESVKMVLWFNPLIHVVGVIRTAFYPGYRGDYVNLLFVFFVAALLFIMGSVMLVRRRTQVVESL